MKAKKQEMVGLGWSRNLLATSDREIDVRQRTFEPCN